MAEIEGLVRALREGDDAAKTAAARELGNLVFPFILSWSRRTKAAIAEAGGIPLLVELVRDGTCSALHPHGDKRWVAARALGMLARDNDANQVLIAAAGAIVPLFELLRDGHAAVKMHAGFTLRSLARNNDANAVAIAAVGFEALVQLARSGNVTDDNVTVVHDAGVPAKRKAALVVATLLRDSVPEFKSAPDDIKAAIGSCL